MVAGKNDITITLSDGSSYYSNLTGYDPLTNIAILAVNNIPQSKLTSSLQLGNSSNLEEGQQVTCYRQYTRFEKSNYKWHNQWT